MEVVKGYLRSHFAPFLCYNRCMLVQPLQVLQAKYVYSRPSTVKKLWLNYQFLGVISRFGNNGD
jgi:hypothetical protein